MKKEYKDFYRFLWEYLEDGNSAIVIKPRQVGMTSFAARYAAWCADYKDTPIKVASCNTAMTRIFSDLVKDFRVRIWNSGFEKFDQTNSDFMIFDEIDFIPTERIVRQLEGREVSQFLAYTTINDMCSLSEFRRIALHKLKDPSKFHVFDISNFTENKFYEETFHRKH